MTMLQSLLSGTLIGMTVAAPIGPMGALCIQRTLADGFRAGFATGLGAATVHLIYSSVIILGLDAVARHWFAANLEALSLASALILFWFAVRAWRPMGVGNLVGQEALCLSRSYWSAIGLGAVNPLTVLLLIAGLQAVAGVTARTELVAGVFLGSAAWWLFLSAAVSKIRTYLSGNALSIGNKIASLTLVGLGAWALLRIAGRSLV